MNIRVDFDDGELRKALDRLGPEVLARAEGALADEVDETTSEAKQFAPVDTGALRDSIEGTASGLEGQVEVGEFYGVWVEFGTSSPNYPVQPFMTPASEQARRRFPKRVGDAMGDLS